MNKINLNNKVAVVTGGAQGFGLAMSKRLIESGATVIIWDIDDKAGGNAIKVINSKNCFYTNLDVANFKSIENNLKEIIKSHNKIDIFINNAGMTGPNEKVWNYSIDEWKKVIELNLNSTFYCLYPSSGHRRR